MELDTIPPWLSGKYQLRVVVETSRGSRHKYNYDPELGAMVLRKTLAHGLTFPLDFGFVPRTEGEDGDCIDVMVLADEPVRGPSVVDCRLIGAVEGTQIERGRKVRNDRFLAVALTSSFAETVTTPTELPGKMLADLRDFFVTSNRLEGREFIVGPTLGPAAAWPRLKRFDVGEALAV